MTPKLNIIGYKMYKLYKVIEFSNVAIITSVVNLNFYYILFRSKAHFCYNILT